MMMTKAKHPANSIHSPFAMAAAGQISGGIFVPMEAPEIFFIVMLVFRLNAVAYWKKVTKLINELCFISIKFENGFLPSLI